MPRGKPPRPRPPYFVYCTHSTYVISPSFAFWNTNRDHRHVSPTAPSLHTQTREALCRGGNTFMPRERTKDLHQIYCSAALPCFQQRQTPPPPSSVSPIHVARIHVMRCMRPEILAAISTFIYALVSISELRRRVSREKGSSKCPGACCGGCDRLLAKEELWYDLFKISISYCHRRFATVQSTVRSVHLLYAWSYTISYHTQITFLTFYRPIIPTLIPTYRASACSAKMHPSLSLIPYFHHKRALRLSCGSCKSSVSLFKKP